MNAEGREASGQRWDPQLYARNARFVSDLAMPVVELLAPSPGERILDLGCGDGVLTAKLSALGCSVVGVDASPEQVAVARAAGLDARVEDARELPFEAEFDAVFSNATLHWIHEADAVIAGVHRALRPGGRFVAEMGGHGNIAAVERALHRALAGRGVEGDRVNPWYFPSPEEYRRKLEARGFSVVSMELIPRPTTLPGDLSDWIETFGGSFTSALPAGERPAFVAEVREAVAPILRNAEGAWIADYVRLRFSARKG